MWNLEKTEQGDWFQFFDSRPDQQTGEIIYDPPSEDSKEEFCIRVMGPFWEEHIAARKKGSKIVPHPQTRQMVRVAYSEDLTPEQEKKERDDAWDYAIVGWKNLKGPDGKDIPCTRDNKLKMIKIPKFMRFVQRCFQILDGEVADTREAAAKN
jgi:hypothetical protein